jgi:transposase
MVTHLRNQAGRQAQTSMIIVDARSVKNTNTAKEKGYDGGKKISGIKRHIAVDSQGLPHGISITKANETDRNGAITILRENKEQLAKVKKILVDGGYSGEAFANQVKEGLQEAEVEVAKRSELHQFKVTPKRWLVERSFGWLEKCRRLWKNCERKLEISLQMVVLAFLKICLQRL